MGQRSNAKLPFGYFIAFWCVGVLAIDLSMAYAFLRQARTTSFEQTDGQITKSEIVGSGTSGHTVIEFEYNTPDGMHKSKQVRFGWQQGRSEARRYPIGIEVKAYFDPDDPSVAVLRTGYEPADAVTFMFLLPFNSAALLFFVAGPVGWIAARKRNRLHLANAHDSEDRIGRIISSPSRFTRGLFIASIASVLCMLAGSIAGVLDSWTGIYAATAIICFAAIAAAALPEPKWLDRDKHQYRLDRKNRLIKLPNRPAGILGRTELAMEEIQEIRVISSRDGSPFKRKVFDVVLDLKSGREVAVDRFTTYERAERTASQLIQQVFPQK